MIEYIGGKAQINHDRRYTVMTNEPAYQKQIENLKQYRTFGGDKPLPGERKSMDRFAGHGTQVVSVHPGPIATDMGKKAGLEEIAEPPSLVSDSIWQALKKGQFHAFPDSMAKQIGSLYKSFAESVVEASITEGPA